MPRSARQACTGTAQLAGCAYRGDTMDALLRRIGPGPSDPVARAAWLMDLSLTHNLFFRPHDAAILQAEALARASVFRVRGPASGAAAAGLHGPGRPDDERAAGFPHHPDRRAAGSGVRAAGPGPLPDPLPDHDIAIVAASESAPDVLRDLAALLPTWPRPVLNNPCRILTMSRDWLAEALAGLPGLAIAPTIRISRTALVQGAVPMDYPVLLRPAASHAGIGLMKVAGPADLAQFLAEAEGDAFYLTRFIEYRGADGWYPQVSRGLRGPAAVPLPHGRVRAVDGALPQCRDGGECGQARGGGPGHGRIRYGFRRPATLPPSQGCAT
ncbi:MAG: hypothetical protein WDN49_22965 [Acetobacteraceae bacterium]